MRLTTSAGIGMALVGLLFATPASAQDKVSPTLKGISGGVLLGAEIPLMGMSLAGVTNGWALGLIPIATGAGGGVAGYFLVEQNGNAELAMGMLVAGVVLFIPTIGLVVNATAYGFDESDSAVEVFPEDEFASEASAEGEAGEGRVQSGFQLGGSTGGGEEEGGGGEAPPQRSPSPREGLRPGPTSLIQLDRGALALAVPSVALLPPSTTPDGSTRFALSLVSGTF